MLADNPISDTIIDSSFESLLIDELTSKTTAIKLLDDIDSLCDDILKLIKPRLVDYIRNLRSDILTGKEFKTIKEASMICDIPAPTIYRWIGSGRVILYSVSGKNLVSISQVRSVRKSKPVSEPLEEISPT